MPKPPSPNQPDKGALFVRPTNLEEELEAARPLWRHLKGRDLTPEELEDLRQELLRED